jgi:hypothetical protein
MSGGETGKAGDSLPMSMSAQALEPSLAGCWKSVGVTGNVRGTWPQRVVMPAMYDYRPAHMTGHDSRNRNKSSGL